MSLFFNLNYVHVMSVANHVLAEDVILDAGGSKAHWVFDTCPTVTASRGFFRGLLQYEAHEFPR
eukprot:4012372-Prorocentrum_lima.AAC.1